MLSGILPAPKHNYSNVQQKEEIKQEQQQKPKKVLPSYPNRKGFIPMHLEDYGDGGAYPEIHVLQYPLNMGRPGHKTQALIPVQVNDKGTIKTDMLVKQGSNKNRIVQTSLADLKEKEISKNDVALPTEDEEAATAERTRQALQAIVEGKIKSAKPTTVTANNVVEPQYIRYTPNPNAPGFNPAAAQRVIKMVEAQVDPLEPAKHKHTKVPRGPGSPPVPVLHSPPRKLTVADQQAWKIPPCISNWKNSKGFIIPLDKRLAADGRGLQETTISSKFAMLSESLYIAERKAIQDLNVRNDLRKKITLREKEEREQNLREMANRARLERSGISAGAMSTAGTGLGQGQSHGDIQNRLGLDAYGSASGSDDDDHQLPKQEDQQRGGQTRRDYDSSDAESVESIEAFQHETEDEKQARQQRERVRMERRKEREREMRLNNMKGNLRKNKMDREESRDVSEKIALGLLKGTGKLSGEAIYDSRLFNQSSGMDAGFGEEDEYNTYSRPLFDRGEAASIYRPKANEEDAFGDADTQIAKLSDTNRFRPDKGFQGADGGVKQAPREVPVQFEKAVPQDPYARASNSNSHNQNSNNHSSSSHKREDSRDRNRDRDRDGDRDRERERDRYRDEEDDRRHRNKRSKYDE